MNSALTVGVRNGWGLLLAVVVAVLAASVGAYDSGASGSDNLPYPDGYRRWTHVRTVVVGPQSPFYQSGGGMHHIDANEKAMEGYRTRQFPDGAILVFDLYETTEKEGTTSEGARKRIDVC